MTMCGKLMIMRLSSIIRPPPASFKSFSLRQTSTRGFFTQRPEINKQISSLKVPTMTVLSLSSLFGVWVGGNKIEPTPFKGVQSANEYLHNEAKVQKFTTSLHGQTEEKKLTSFPGLQIAKKVALEKAREKNLVLSPFSIQIALSLLANGATGLTKEELLSFLEVENLNDHNLHIKEMLDRITQTSKYGPVISFLSGAWIDQILPLNPKFKTDAEDVYKLAKVENVDFQHKANEVIDKVNQWAKDATNGLIKSVLPKGSLDSLTRLVLANALYFKGRWVDPFKESHTENSKFYLLNGNPVEVPFMTSSKRQYITTFEDFKILRLPYEGQNFSMHIILPNKSDGIWPLIEQVGTDPKFLEKYVTNVSPEVEVGKFGLPKFKITHEFEASEILQGLGLKLCMSEKAEFNKIVSYFKPGEWLQLSKVYHKSYIEVDEKGTEAAAVTGIDMCGCAAPSAIPPVDFVADHPFMFMVRDDRSGMVLFTGHIVNPSLD